MRLPGPLLLAAAGLLPACLSMKSGGEPTALMKVTGTEGSAGQFRALSNELAIRIPAIVESSGDQMLRRTEDPLLRRRAPSWKIEATAGFHQGLFRPDVLGAGIETYALSVQLEDWVGGPGGARYFGDLQPIGLAAVEGRREPHLVLSQHASGTRYRATVGCNQLVGGAAISGENLVTFTPGASTLMGCPAPLDQLERRLSEVLTGTRRYQVTINALELLDGGGKPLALLEAIYL